MKELTKTSRTLGQIEKMFRAINKDLFNGELEEPIFTIQSSPRSYGHMSIKKVWQKKDTTRNEINISAEYLDRPIEDITATLIHELCHLYAQQNGIKDTSRGFTYHNKNFKDIAEKHMLKIDHNEKIGWSITSPTEKLIEYIISKGFEEIEICRKNELWINPIIGKKGGNDNTTGATGTKGKSNSRKYQCPCCKNSVRATKKVNIICGDCKEVMIEC